jgi:hypothetical protein
MVGPRSARRLVKVRSSKGRRRSRRPATDRSSGTNASSSGDPSTPTRERTMSSRRWRCVRQAHSSWRTARGNDCAFFAPAATSCPTHSPGPLRRNRGAAPHLHIGRVDGSRRRSPREARTFSSGRQRGDSRGDARRNQPVGADAAVSLHRTFHFGRSIPGAMSHDRHRRKSRTFASDWHATLRPVCNAFDTERSTARALLEENATTTLNQKMYPSWTHSIPPEIQFCTRSSIDGGSRQRL